jgi:hypothetical protein
MAKRVAQSDVIVKLIGEFHLHLPSSPTAMANTD